MMASWEPKLCRRYVILINYILCNKIVSDYKFIYFINRILVFYLKSTDVWKETATLIVESPGADE